MVSKLKSCPVHWCGSEAYCYRMFGKQSRRIRCKCCGLEGNTFETEAEAITEWNTRPNDAVIEAAQKVADATRTVQEYDDEKDNHQNIEYWTGILLLLNSCEPLAALLPAKGEKP